jgi:tetratricopeptide (TPR) repeat protein
VGSAPGALQPGQRSIADIVGAVGVYLGRLLWPVQLNAYIDHIDRGATTTVLAALLFVACAAALWQWWSLRTSAPQPLRAPLSAIPLFALAWLLLTLVPSLAILWKIPDAPLAERYLYLPSVGFCLLVGYAVERLWQAAPSPAWRRGLAIAGTVVLALCAVATVRRNAVWHDDIALWEDTEPKSRVSGMAARSLGTAYQQAGRPADARAAFERALRLHNTPRGLQTLHNNLGTLAMYDGDWVAAQRHYQQALDANPGGADSMFNLGLAVLHAGNRSAEAARAALAHYQRAQAINPHDSDIEAALAEVYDLLGDRAAAVAHARRALDLGASGQTADSLNALLKRPQ